MIEVKIPVPQLKPERCWQYWQLYTQYCHSGANKEQQEEARYRLKVHMGWCAECQSWWQWIGKQGSEFIYPED